MTTRTGEGFYFPAVSAGPSIFNHLSFMGAQSAFGTLNVNMSSWTVANFADHDRTVDFAETSAAAIAASFATLIKELKEKKVIA